jgi:phage-related protein
MSVGQQWVVQALNHIVEQELAALPPDIRARFARFTQVIREDGLHALPFGWVKPLGDKLWELRLTGRDGIARAIYIAASGRRVVIVRAFIKKTEKTPKRELDLARERAKDVT